MEALVAPVVAGVVVLLTLIGVIGTAIREPRPHDIPVAITGPAPALAQLTQAFATNAPGAFKLTAYDGEASARKALDDREAVGALVLGQAPRLIVAGAAGDAVTGGVTAAFTNVFKAQGTALAVETVHPFQPGDPHGILLFFLVFATIVSSLLAGALTGFRLAGWSAIGVVVAFALSAGVFGPLAVAWLADGYGDRLWQVMAIVALLGVAVAAVTSGLTRTAGAPGAALSGLVLVLLAVISAGGPLGSELLPDAYRAIGPWLPAGPAFSAVRGALYFDGVGVWTPVALLSGYALAGVALLAVAAPRRTTAPGLMPAAA